MRNTSESHPDLPSLLKALEAVASVAKHINAEMHAAEKRNAILRLQSEFTDKVNWVSPSRKFVRQGPMVKQCRDSQKMYEFFLFNDQVVYASRATVGGKYKLHRELPITTGFEVNDVPSPLPPAKEAASAAATTAATEDPAAYDWSKNGYPFKFELRNQKKSFIVSVPDQVTKTAWLTDFAAVLNERNAIEREKEQFKTGQQGAAATTAPTPTPTARVAPIWKSDKSEDSCPCCTKKFTLVRRRHHW